MVGNNSLIELDSRDMVLLITGCIAPNTKQKFLYLTDTQIRLKQYIDSCKFYIENSLFTNIVFCENSQYYFDKVHELYKFAKRFNKKFEWISFQGDNEKVLSCGKGYGEGEIVEYALQHSVLLKSAKSFTKVTGRLKVRNIIQLMKNVKCGKNYFNRDIYRGHGIDTRFYICDINFYQKHLQSAYLLTKETEDEIVALEDIFYKILHKLKLYRSLMRYPDFQGVSGGNGRDYSQIKHYKIVIYSLLCYINIFNGVYPFVLAVQKLKLLLKNCSIIRLERKQND